MKICGDDGLAFKTEAELKFHMDMQDMLRETVQAERYQKET